MEVHPVGDLMSPKGQSPSNLRDGDIGKKREFRKDQYML